MSLDPVLRFFHCDFPQLTKSTYGRLDFCSWWGQIVVPAGAGLYAVSQKEYSDVWLLARALLVNQAFIDTMKKIISERRPNILIVTQKLAFGAARKSSRLNDRKASCIKPIQLALRSFNPEFLARSKCQFLSHDQYNQHESFPSGHTAAVFVVPVYIVMKYGCKRAKVPTILSIMAAVFVAASRVILKAHWVHDVIAGTLLGCSVMYLSMKVAEKNETSLTASAGICSLIVLVLKLSKKIGKAVSRILS